MSDRQYQALERASQRAERPETRAFYAEWGRLRLAALHARADGLDGFADALDEAVESYVDHFQRMQS